MRRSQLFGLLLTCAPSAFASYVYDLSGYADTIIKAIEPSSGVGLAIEANIGLEVSSGGPYAAKFAGGAEGIQVEGYYKGIRANSTGGGVGFYTETGVYSEGDIAVDALGDTIGVRASGGKGVVAVGASTYGIEATGVTRGISASTTSGIGLHASSGSGYAVQAASSTNAGIHTTGNYYGILAYITDQYEGSAIFGQGHTNGAYAATFNGNTYATGSYQGSDIALKKNVRPLQNGLGKVMALHPKRYEMRTEEFKGKLVLPEGSKIGLIAQDVEQVFPELVTSVSIPAQLTETEQKNGVKKEPTKFKAVDYTSLIPVLIQAIQEQQAEIEDLKRALGR